MRAELPGRIDKYAAHGCRGVEDGVGCGCDGGDHVAGLGIAQDGDPVARRAPPLEGDDEADGGVEAVLVGLGRFG